MHNKSNCHENVWILSGTADGPIIANKLLELKFTVFVSVVSYRGSKAYPLNKNLYIKIGRLNNVTEIQKFIKKNNIKHVIDATHPFAIEISKSLITACVQFDKPVLRFERSLNNINFDNNSTFQIIDDFKDIKGSEIKGKNLLLAIGSRSIDKVASYYKTLGANIFARIIATPKSVLEGLSSCIENSNIAILNPTKLNSFRIEYFLCEYWNIDYIICRESGGYPQKLWEEISYSSQIKLFLLKRPKVRNKLIFSSYDDLIRNINLNI